jgi:16S rRNA (uracil1498-N3)-methyltransferase
MRFFGEIKNNKAILGDGELHHLFNVMRRKVGDQIDVVYAGDTYKCEITSIKPVSIDVIEIIQDDSELPCDLILAFALLKGGHDELVYMKGTELGVSSFAPFLSRRTIIELPKEKDKEKKLERANKIVKGASEQSRRTIVPEVYPISTFKNILSIKADHKLFAYENESHTAISIKTALKDLKKGETTLVVIGPEGGFSPEEVELAKNNGFTFVSLGKRILRAETASIFAASVHSLLAEEIK